MKNLLARALSGAVYVAIIVACTLLGGWCFTGLLIALTVLAVVEFRTLTMPRSESSLERVVPYIMDVIGAAAITLAIAWDIWFLMVVLLYLLLRPVVQLYIHDEVPVRSVCLSYASMLYIAFPLALLSGLERSLGPDQGRWIVFAMFVMIWLNDTGAYLVGSAIGRHKLFPSVSPGKTWEGWAGGTVFAVASAFILKYCFPSLYEGVGTGPLVAMAGIVAVFGTWGDLVESRIKRSLHVKDSGHIMPGHGGILDRIDSLLLVAPATVLLFLALTYF